jgi:hypothetical protein
MIAGYSAQDSINAIMAHQSYKVEMSSKIAFSAMTFGLSFSFEISKTWIVNAAANAIINSAVQTAARTAIVELVKYDAGRNK